MAIYHYSVSITKNQRQIRSSSYVICDGITDETDIQNLIHFITNKYAESWDISPDSICIVSLTRVDTNG